MPSNTDPKTILLKGDPLAVEYPAGDGNLTPGLLAVLGSAGTITRHAALLGGPVLIVREEEYVGGSIDTLYANADRVPCYVMKPGDEFWGFLEDEHASVSPGQIMEAGDNGTFQALTTGVPLTQALETKSAVGGPAIGTRIRLRAL